MRPSPGSHLPPTPAHRVFGPPTLARGCLHAVACTWSLARGRLRVVACAWSLAYGCLHAVACAWSLAYGCLHVVACTWSLARGRLHVVACIWSLARGRLRVVACTWSFASPPRDECTVGVLRAIRGALRLGMGKPLGVLSSHAQLPSSEPTTTMPNTMSPSPMVFQHNAARDAQPLGCCAPSCGGHVFVALSVHLLFRSPAHHPRHPWARTLCNPSDAAIKGMPVRGVCVCV